MMASSAAFAAFAAPCAAVAAVWAVVAPGEPGAVVLGVVSLHLGRRGIAIGRHVGGHRTRVLASATSATLWISSRLAWWASATMPAYISALPCSVSALPCAALLGFRNWPAAPSPQPCRLLPQPSSVARRRQLPCGRSTRRLAAALARIAGVVRDRVRTRWASAAMFPSWAVTAASAAVAASSAAVAAVSAALWATIRAESISPDPSPSISVMIGRRCIIAAAAAAARREPEREHGREAQRDQVFLYRHLQGSPLEG